MEGFAKVRRVLAEAHQSAVEGLINFIITVPLRDELVLQERTKIACEERVHVDPHTAVIP